MVKLLTNYRIDFEKIKLQAPEHFFQVPGIIIFINASYKCFNIFLLILLLIVLVKKFLFLFIVKLLH